MGRLPGDRLHRRGLPRRLAHRWDITDALPELAALPPGLRQSRTMIGLFQPRLLAERGANELAPDPEPLLAAARNSRSCSDRGSTQLMLPACPSAPTPCSDRAAASSPSPSPPRCRSPRRGSVPVDGLQARARRDRRPARADGRRGVVGTSAIPYPVGHQVFRARALPHRAEDSLRDGASTPRCLSPVCRCASRRPRPACTRSPAQGLRDGDCMLRHPRKLCAGFFGSRFSLVATDTGWE
jgi:hypothetical protein